MRRRKLFIEAMLQTNFNATQSAKMAGYSEKSAIRIGHRLSTDVRVISELQARKDKIAARFELTTDKIAMELARIAYFDPAHCFKEDGQTIRQIHDIPEDSRRALASFKKGEFRAFSKPEALGKAMLYLGMIKRQNITAIAQSAAAAEVTVQPENQTSMLEAARRIAFTLSMGATKVPAPKPKQPA